MKSNNPRIAWNKGLTKADPKYKKSCEKMLKTKLEKYGTLNSFGEVPWNRGLTLDDPRVMRYTKKSNATRSKIYGKSQGLCLHNKPHSDESKRKMSLAKKGRSWEEQCGKEVTKKRKEALLLRQKKKWQNRHDTVWKQVKELYDQGVSDTAIGFKLNIRQSIISRIRQGLGLLPNNRMGINNRTCLDGHIVHSFYEEMIDNWLNHNDFKHRVQVKIPTTNYRSDFLIDDLHLEYAGLIRFKCYRQRLQKKMAVYEKLGIKYAIIEGETIKEVVDQLKSLLKPQKIPAINFLAYTNLNLGG